MSHEFDLSFSRTVPVPPAILWRAWTMPEYVVKWFTPAPWKTVACEIDLKPGGLFHTVMNGPDGEVFDNTGCWLEAVPHSRLAWTGALQPGYRPAVAVPGGFFFTAVLQFDEAPGGAAYTATVMHSCAADRDRHAAMGFEQGWGMALDQLVAAAATMA